MSEKLYAEEVVRGAIKHFWPMGDDDGVNRYLATLPAASAPVVTSDPLYGVSCEHMGNGSARWSMSQQKENELRELLYPTPSPSDQVQEALDLGASLYRLVIKAMQERYWMSTPSEIAERKTELAKIEAVLSTGVTPRD